MKYSLGNVTTGSPVKAYRRNASQLAIAAYGVISSPPPPPPPPQGNDKVPLTSPSIVSMRNQYAAICRVGTVEGATSYDMRWSWDQTNWTQVSNVAEIHELVFPGHSANRKLYAEHRAVVDGVAQSWQARGSGTVVATGPIQLIVHPRGKEWQIGDRLADYVSPEGLTLAQMANASNVIASDGAVVTAVNLLWNNYVGDLKSLTQRADVHEQVHYAIQVQYRTAAGSDQTAIFDPIPRLAAPTVWLDVRETQGTDQINIPANVPDAMVLPDFKHVINGITYTTSGVTVAQLRAGPVAVTGASGVTIANVAAGQWATVGVAAGADMMVHMGRQYVWLPVYGSNPGPRAGITLTRADQKVVGEGVMAELKVWGFNSRRNWREVWDDPFHTLEAQWTVPGGARTVPLNMRTPWRDGTKAFGFSPKFVVETAGNWTVSVMVSELSSGKFAFTTSATQTTVDPNTAFPGAQTIIVTGGGSTAGAPAGATVVSTPTEADAAVKANALPKRVMFSSHIAKHVLTKQIVFSTGWPNVYLDSYGPGKAVLESTVSSILVVYAKNVGQSGVIIRNLYLKGGWDPTTETGPRFKGIIFNIGGFSTVSRCIFEGLETNLNTVTYERAGMIIAAHNQSKSHLDFITYFEGPHVGMIGNQFMQHVDALQGGGSKQGPNRHFIRFERCLSVYAEGNDFFTRNGWTTSAFGPADQAFRDHRNDPKSNGHFVQNSFEGGFTMFAQGAASPDQTGLGILFPCNTLVERNKFTTSARTTGIITAMPCTTIRGNEMIRVNAKVVPSFSTAKENFNGFIWVGKGDKNDVHPSASKERAKVYSNSFIDLATRATDPSTTFEPLRVRDTSTWVEYGNNLHHAPNHEDYGTTPFAPMQAVDEGMTPRYKGYRWKKNNIGNIPAGDQLEMLTEHASPADSMRSWRPAAGSPAAIAEDGLRALTDFDGNLAPGMPNGVGTTVAGTMWVGAVKPLAA
ncbi:hypothetical protein [Paracoccus sp. SY]|uniref:hypothetical protein n=1 Tax=Paracoccus sp. SY TaxID=1330255 RepID=UPI0011AFD276|nr:hypothetical protein [Paracoccus sp. SY]